MRDNSYGGWTDTKLFYCTAGETPTVANQVADWGERDMGSAQTLTDFINYCKTNYPGAALRPVLLGPRLPLVPGLLHRA